MTLIAEITHDVTAKPAPVLFLDSCILLDVVRAPLRGNPDEVRFAQLFLTSVQKNQRPFIFSSPPRPRESGTDHIAETENDCTIAVNAATLWRRYAVIWRFPSRIPAGWRTHPVNSASESVRRSPRRCYSPWITTPLPWDELSIVSSLQHPGKAGRQGGQGLGYPRTCRGSDYATQNCRVYGNLYLSSARTPRILQMQVPPTCMRNSHRHSTL